MPERGSIKVTVVGATDVGRVREHNEDNFLVVDLTAGERAESGRAIVRELGDKGFLLAVADGMGGAASGELASEMAVDTVFERLRQRALLEEQATAAEMTKSLSETIVVANEKIWERSQAENEHRGMGTTMTAAYLLGDDLAIAQVGDSRAYLMRKGKLVQVTKDQSLIGQLIEDGTLTPEEAAKIGGQNIILQALGVEATVSVDAKVMEILAGDVLVLCSDGLSGMVKDEIIEKTLAEATDMSVACTKLVSLANDGGGRDNITVIVAEFTGEGLRSPMKPLEAEEAGGGGRATSFAPPPPPEAKTGSPRLALLGGAGAVIVLVLLFFLLTGGTADVTFTFPEAGATGQLIPLSVEGEPILLEPVPGSREFFVADLEPGRYMLSVTLDRYQPLERDVEFARGESEMKVALRPLPGDILFVPKTPRVDLVLRPAGDVPEGEGWDRTLRFLSLASQVAQQVPAGRIVLEQSRAGFRPSVREIELPPGGGPEGKIEVELDELEPVLAEVVLEFDPALADGRGKVVVVDEFGAEVYTGEVPLGGKLSARMRVGNHTMRLSHPRFKDESKDLVVTESGAESAGPISLPPREGTLVVRAPAESFVKISQGEHILRTEPVPAEGELEVAVAPGDYDITLLGSGVTKRVNIRSAEKTRVEF